MNTSIKSPLAGMRAPFLLLFLALVKFPRTTEAFEKTLLRVEGENLFAIFTSSSGSIYNM